MDCVFIINPKAGGGKKADALIKKIRTELGEEAKIYITKAPGDGQAFVKAYCEEKGGARFIACGGDGTAGEVLNGAIGTENAEIGVIPVGTGNDFCRNFGVGIDFEDVTGQMTGESDSCDAIHYTTQTAEGEKSGYCINMFNIGFDANVADLKNRMEKLSFLPGAISYILAVFAMLIRKKGANLKIEVDGETVHSGKLLLTSVANGAYCGGGIQSNPLASVTDGRININIIKNLSRMRFISLFPKYAKGEILGVRGIENILHNGSCERIKITPLEGKMKLCIDGEIIEAGETEFEIRKGAFRFVLPKQRVKITV